MSNTFKTNIARIAHKLKKIVYSEMNQSIKDPSAVIETNRINDVFRDVKFAGTRYGNKRKSEAHNKVLVRRIERRKLNRFID